jgi:hypothetical protein
MKALGGREGILYNLNRFETNNNNNIINNDL